MCVLADGVVMYVGKAGELRQVVHGTRMGRAYNGYTYVPPSKVVQTGSPRVRVNGPLNAAMDDGSVVTWWWLETASVEEALRLEGRLIGEWNHAWNRACPQCP